MLTIEGEPPMQPTMRDRAGPLPPRARVALSGLRAAGRGAAQWRGGDAW